eukprot:5519369-Pleurochrysis_carterae.AAC.1
MLRCVEIFRSISGETLPKRVRSMHGFQKALQTRRNNSPTPGYPHVIGTYAQNWSRLREIHRDTRRYTEPEVC